ncbi:MAG: diguanylate cyclase [Erythrobacter sp.]
MRELIFLLFTPIMVAILAGTFAILWQRDRERKENLALSVGWLLMGIGVTISEFSPVEFGRAHLPITSLLFILSAIHISWANLERLSIKQPVVPWLIIAMCCAVCLAISQLGGGTVIADLYLINIACGTVFLMCIQLIMQREQPDPIDKALAWILVIVTAQFFVRPPITMMFDTEITGNTFKDSVYYTMLLGMLSIGSVMFGFVQVAASVKDQFVAVQRKTAFDDLSGLLLRGQFEQQVREKLADAATNNVPVALVIGDLDHFKQVNDIWGHQVGDRAIREFGGMLSRMTRDCDIAGRIGGEEFCVLVWDADATIVTRLAERLRVSTTLLEIDQDRLDVRLTASFGVAVRNGNEDYRSLFARTDKALYSAKQKDRNCVVCADAEEFLADAQDETLLANSDRPARAGFSA